MPTNAITATSISSSSTKALGVGQAVTFTLNLNSQARVTGAPRLTLSNGAYATYVSSTNHSALTFQYTVSAGDDTNDVTITGLDLSGGAIATPSRVFVPGSTIQAHAGAIAAGDFDGDGKSDVIVSDSVVGGFRVYLGDGQGGLTASTGYAAGGTPQGAITTADFNGDGRPDLAYIDASNHLSVALNNGGGFTFAGTYIPFVFVSKVMAGDINGDGNPDIVASIYDGKGNTGGYVLLGAGDGTFPTQILNGVPYGTELADFNRDGRSDLILIGSNGSFIKLNSGSGFILSDGIGYGVSSPSSTSVGDFNGDGLLEFATIKSDRYGQYTDVFLANGVGHVSNGTGAGANYITPATYSQVDGGYTLATQDLDGDGLTDLVNLSNTGGTINVYFSDGTINLYGPTTYHPFAGTVQVSSYAVTDLNADGFPDIVATGSDGSLAVLLNTYQAPSILSSASVAAASGADTHIVVDTVAPVVTAILANDTGASSTDHITSNAALTGTGEASGTVTVRNGTTVLGTVTVGSDGRWTVTPFLADGSYTLTVTEPDAAGNVGTATISLTLDRTAQAVGIALARDTGSSATDKLTRDANLAGTAEVGATITVLNGAAVLGTTMASVTGAWTFVPTLTDGSYSLTAQQTDLAGNTGGSATLSFTLDTVPPVVTARVTNETGAAGSGVAADPVLAGTAEAGGTVQVLAGSTVVGTAVVGADGQWSATPSLTAGPHTLTVAEADVAGNVGSTTLSVTQTQYHGSDQLFSTQGYLGAYRDVRTADVSPFGHYDQFGWKEGRDPSALFDTRLYLRFNPDVAQAGVDPLTHYLAFGLSEGRKSSPVIDSDQVRDGFDPLYYTLANPDVGLAGVDPLAHWQQFGAHESRNPDAFFDAGYYLSHNPDVAAAGVNPLDHYNQFGWHEGRNPSTHFTTGAYLSANPDVAAAGANPLQHFLQFGAAEGRSAQGNLY